GPPAIPCRKRCRAAWPFSLSGKHTVVADDDGRGRLWRLGAALADVLLESAEALEARQRWPAIVGHRDMDEGVVGQPEHGVAQPGRRLVLEFVEYRRTQALVLVGPFGLGAIAYQGPFHGVCLLRRSCPGRRMAGAEGF